MFCSNDIQIFGFCCFCCWALARDAQIGGELKRRDARRVIAELVAEHGPITVLDLLREVATEAK